MSLACSAGGIVCFLLIFGDFVSVFVYLFGGLSVFVGQTSYVRKSQTSLRREAGHSDTKSSKIAREHKKSPASTCKGRSFPRYHPNSLYIRSTIRSFTHVTCANVSGYLSYFVHSCGSGVKVNDYLVFKGTFSRWFPLSEKSIIICGQATFYESHGTSAKKPVDLHHLCLFDINFDSSTVFLKRQDFFYFSLNLVLRLCLTRSLFFRENS